MVLTERMQALGGHARSAHQRLLAEQRQESKDSETRGREGGDSAQDAFDSGAFASANPESGQQDFVQDNPGQNNPGHNPGNGFEQAARAALRAARELSLPPEEIESIIVDRIAAHLSGRIPIETVEELPDDDLPDEMTGEGHASAIAALEEIDYDDLPRVPSQRPANDSAELATAQTANETAAETLVHSEISESTVAAETVEAVEIVAAVQADDLASQNSSDASIDTSGEASSETPAESLDERAPASELLSESAAAAETSFADTSTQPLAGAQPQAHGVATAGESDHDFAARQAIIHEWMNWSALNSDDAEDPNAVNYFLRHLEMKKPKLLDFAAEEKAQVVRAWLVAARCLAA